jgi:hypothetical protein
MTILRGARAFVFCVMAAAVSSGCAGRNDLHRTGPASAQSTVPAGGAGDSAPEAVAPAADVKLPSFGVSLPIPRGYVRDIDGAKSVAFFAAPGAKAGTADRVLMVDLLPLRGGTTLRQDAERVATEERMKAASDPARWGGLEAAELFSANPTYNLPVAAHRMLLVRREGYAYRLTYLSTPQHAADLAAYRAVAEGTRWLPMEHAGRGVAGRRPVVSLPTGIAFMIPDPFRPDMSSQQKHVSAFLAFDMLLGRPVGRLTVIPFAEKDPSHTMEKVKAELAEKLGPIWQLKGPLNWTDDAAGSVQLSSAGGASGEDRWVDVLVARVGDGRGTVFALQYDRGEAADGMNRALPLLKASIRPAPDR